MKIKQQVGYYKKSVAPVRQINGQASGRHNWEVALVGRSVSILGCGTALTDDEAEAQADALISAHASVNTSTSDKKNRKYLSIKILTRPSRPNAKSPVCNRLVAMSK